MAYIERAADGFPEPFSPGINRRRTSAGQTVPVGWQPELPGSEAARERGAGGETNAPRMRIRKLARLLVLFCFIPGNLHAQSLDDLIRRATAFDDQGKFHEAIALLDPLLRSPASDTVDSRIGVAWNTQGVALQNMGDLESARRSYENAIRILRDVPDLSIQYAAALDNLGSLMAEEGQLPESISVRTRARQVYQSLGDHAGVARISTNLAIVAIGQRSRKRAGQFLADAWSEESQVAAPDTGDIAQIYTVEAVLRQKTGNLQAALDSINRAIQFWTERYGGRYYVLAVCYAVRGNVEEKLRDRDAAMADFRHSLDLVQQANTGNSKVYFMIESSYAKALRDSGERAEAKRFESNAREGLEGLRENSCADCSISAAGFR
jgi:tetratricopeptide (TPR) repeat protein